MKRTYIFWYGTKDGKNYLLAEIECSKPKQTKAFKNLGKLMGFDDDVIVSGFELKDEPYMQRFRYPSLLPHSSRNSGLSL